MHNEKEDKFMSAVTGNKGRHFYFSLSKSIASGLRLTTNTSKLVVCHDKLQKLGFQVDKPSMDDDRRQGRGGLLLLCAHQLFRQGVQMGIQAVQEQRPAGVPLMADRLAQRVICCTGRSEQAQEHSGVRRRSWDFQAEAGSDRSKHGQGRCRSA